MTGETEKGLCIPEYISLIGPRETPSPAPKWDSVCFPQRGRPSRSVTDEERQAEAGGQEVKNAQRIAVLADWVLDAMQGEAVDGDEFERLMAAGLRTNELSILQAAVAAPPADRGLMIAAALRNSPTPVFLEIVALLLEMNAFIRAAKSSKKTTLTSEQITLVRRYEDIKQILLRAYRTSTTEKNIERRATDVLKFLYSYTPSEVSDARREYKDDKSLRKRLLWELHQTLARRK